MIGRLRYFENVWFVEYKMEFDLIATDEGQIDFCPEDAKYLTDLYENHYDEIQLMPYVWDGMPVEFEVFESQEDGKILAKLLKKTFSNNEKKEMSLSEFRNKAVEIVSNYGLGEHAVTVIAGYYGHHTSSNIYYTARVWWQEKRRHITSELHKNPKATLDGLKDELERQFKKYDETIKDIEL